jgi:hypothetical protein
VNEYEEERKTKGRLKVFMSIQNHVVPLLEHICDSKLTYENRHVKQFKDSTIRNMFERYPLFSTVRQKTTFLSSTVNNLRDADTSDHINASQVPENYTKGDLI